MAYAAGRRSPYEPLRVVPSTWEIFRAAVGPAAPTTAIRQSWAFTLLSRLRASVVNRALRLGRNVPKHLTDEAFAVFDWR